MSERRLAEPTAYDIVIVGAGPVGLTLAALVRQQGRAVLVVERRAAPVAHGRAMHLDRASIELLAAAGVRWRPGVDLDPLAGVAFVRPGGAELRIERGGLCPDAIAPFAFFQPAIERELTAVLARSAVTLSFDSTLARLDLHDDAAHLVLREGASGAVRTVSAPLVVGCDGAHSTVRAAAGLPWQRWLDGARWRATDYRLDRALDDRLVRHSLLAQPTTVVPGCGRIARFETRLAPGEHAIAPGDAAIAAAATAFGVDIEATLASRVYRYETRVALRTHRSVGRASVVIMGDAAHTVAPFLGQGLGLGLRDAAQLAALLGGATASAGDAMTGDALAPLVARYSRLRRRDVYTTALQSMAAQALVEQGGAMAPPRLDRLLRALSRTTGLAPGLVHRLALAHRPATGAGRAGSTTGITDAAGATDAVGAVPPVGLSAGTQRR